MKNALIGILLIGSTIPAFEGYEHRFDPPPAQRPPPSYGQSLYPEQTRDYTPYERGYQAEPGLERWPWGPHWDEDE